MIVQSYNLSFDTGNVKPKLFVSQYDTARLIQFILDFTPNNASVLINDTQVASEIDNNVVSFLFADTSEVGIKHGELRCDGNGSVNFEIEIEYTPLSSLILPMSNYINLDRTSPRTAEIEPSEELETEEELNEEETEKSVFLNEKENENEERESSL